MPVPYRYQEVKALCEQHPAFPQGEQNDPARLTFLRTVIIPELNRLDGGAWGCLTKNDHPGGPFVPCDILCWKPTRQLVDCMTGTGATWNVMAPGPDTWEWTAVGAAPPVQPPVTPPASTARAVFLAPITLPLALGTAVDQEDGSVVVVNEDGATVVSVQPDGSIEARPRDAIGAWERAKWAGPTVLCYGGTGKDFYVMCQPRG